MYNFVSTSSLPTSLHAFKRTSSLGKIPDSATTINSSLTKLKVKRSNSNVGYPSITSQKSLGGKLTRRNTAEVLSQSPLKSTKIDSRSQTPFTFVSPNTSGIRSMISLQPHRKTSLVN